MLHPTLEATADRWSKILSAQYTTLKDPAPGVRLVVAWGLAAEAPAQVFASRSGSRVAACERLSDLLKIVEDAPERFVVIAALAEQLTAGSLATLSAAFRGAGRSVGYLTGRGPAELSFAVAKALLNPRGDEGSIEVFDAASHRDANNVQSLGDNFEGRLKAPSLVKAMRAHGEGGHAKFPGLVVCGVLESAEFPETSAEGCGQEPRRCKRGGAERPVVLLAHEIRAAVVAFVCCNGFSVAGELYPSPVSMALGLSEGWVGTLIAPIRPLIAPDAIFNTLLERLGQGIQFGPLIDELNAHSSLLHQPDAFVLHGDPYSSLPQDASLPVQPESVTPSSAAGGSLEGLAEWVAVSLRRSGRARRILSSAEAWLGLDAPPQLSALVQDLDSLERSLLNALKWAGSLPSGDSMQLFQRSCTVMRAAQTGWDRRLLELLLASRETFDAFDLGHYDQAWLAVEPGPACPRCATPTELHLFGSKEAPEDQRVAEACIVCGPLSEGRIQGLRVHIQNIVDASDDSSACVISAQLRVPQGLAISNVVQVRMRLYDKANGGHVADQLMRVPANDSVLEFRCQLPPAFGFDLHSARIVAASGFDLAYARGRYARLPR